MAACARVVESVFRAELDLFMVFILPISEVDVSDVILPSWQNYRSFRPSQ